MAEINGYPVLSVSKIKHWKACRQAYYYKHVENLRPIRQPRPFYLGSVVHEGIEAYFTGMNPQDVVDKYIKEFNELDGLDQEYYGFNFPDLITSMIMGHAKHWEEEDEDLVVHQVEVEFGYDEPLELVPGLYLRGRIDAIAENSRGMWVIENKTAKSIPDDDFRFFDIQTSIYIPVARKLGYQVTGTIYNYLKKKVPVEPEVLKRGGLSVKKSMDTTFEIYMNAIKRHNLNPNDYKEMLDYIETKGNNFFKRSYVNKPEILMQSLAQDALAVSQDIKANADKPFRNFSRLCSSCEFNPLCQAELMGYDVDFLLKHHYMINNRDTVIEQEVEDEGEVEFNGDTEEK